MDPEIKAQADELFASMGMNMSAAVNIFGDFYIFDLTQGSFEAPRGIGFVRICESPPIKKLLNQGWCGLLLRGGPVRHLGDAAGVNLDRCGGRP